VRVIGFLVLFIAASSAMVLGTWAAVRESAGQSKVGANAIHRLAQNAPDEDFLGLSIRSQTRTMLECHAALTGYSSVVMRYAGPETRDRIVTSCAAAAKRIAQSQPSNGYAFYISAFAAALAGDWTAMNAALVQSQKTSPNEQWVAEARSTMAENYFAHLDEAARQGQDADLAMLVGSRHGVDTLARRYVADRSFRERITSIVERLPARDQQRFLYNVREAFDLLG
jgi:hypothetical protein